MIHRRVTAIFLFAAMVPFTASSETTAKEGIIRAGIVGCDTSHVIAFTNIINAPQASGPMANVEVTVAYPGGSPDMPVSRNRLAGFVDQLRKKDIKIVDSLEELVASCDAVLLESVDGRVHLEQFRAIAKGQPVFIDKPAAASLADVISIFRHADATGTPVFTCSSLRFAEGVSELSADKSIGEMLGCETAGPLDIDGFHPDLFWYGIHGVEPLQAIMGRGCESVSRTDSPLSTVVVGQWRDGRIGSYRGLRKGGAYAFTVYGSKGIAHRSGGGGYEPLLRLICEFFATRKPPVDREDTLEVFAIMEAADESKRRGGAPVNIAQIMQRAEQMAESGKRTTGEGDGKTGGS